MPAVRPVLPTDLAALVGSGRVYPNEAFTLDSVGGDALPRPLEAALEQWLSFATGKHTWISVRGATLRGLVSARRRGTKAAWEIDCLIDAADDDTSVLMSLLDRVASDAGDEGAEKVFLRVPIDSDVLTTARRCGFVPYTSEIILRRDDQSPSSHGVGASAGALRRWARADAYATFRVYNLWTPEAVRRVEAATFREWQAAREKLGPRAHQWVSETNGRVTGWLRTAASGEEGRFEIMADPTEPGVVEGLVEAALARLAEQSLVHCRVHQFAGGLQSCLEERGFRAVREFVLLARPIARTVRLPKLVAVAPA
jgi:hypothetical protein